MKTEFYKRCVWGTATAVLCLTGVRSPFNSPAQAQSISPSSGSATESSALPPNIFPTSPLAQVVRLAQAGVDESVITTFIMNSSSTFNLDSDKIIYLKDIGLPNEVVTTMMQRDQQLQQQMAATTYQPSAQPAPAPPSQPEISPQPVEQPAEVTVNYFYDTLTPYGTWLDVAGYGRCWRPSVVVYNPGWQPYCDHGHWVYTDCGWYWLSDYSWGWAPFHYGRWFQHARWGWCWTPDIVWGPSWVTWRYSDDYCGWAPLPPFAVYREGAGFFYNGLAVSIGFDFGLSWNCFAFVPIGHFCDPHPRRFCAPPTQATQIYSHTTVINNFGVRNHNFVNHGIDPEHITAVTRTPIHPISIRDTTSPVARGAHSDQLSYDGSTLVVNRPHFVDHPVPGENINKRPMPSASSAQNHSLQPNVNQPVPATRQIKPAPVPIQTQRPASSFNYNSSSPPATPAPNNNNSTYSPRGWEQVPPPKPPQPNTYNSRTPAVIPAPYQGQSGASEGSHHSAPAAAQAQSQPQHNESSSSSRSSGQNENQNSSGNNFNNGPGNGSGRGPGH